MKCSTCGRPAVSISTHDGTTSGACADHPALIEYGLVVIAFPSSPLVTGEAPPMEQLPFEDLVGILSRPITSEG